MIPVTLQTAFAVAVAGGCFVLCSVIAAQQRRLSALERKLQHEAATRESEHSGRISAEKELRAFVSSRMKADGGLFFAPIATVHSCFKECVGTPRQGQLAPSTRALLVFRKNSVSPVSLDGLDGFSHLWIFWAFHLNTNAKDARAHSGLRSDSRGHTFSAKVSPPFLKRRVGVFSTRTPHRPNPIGVSLCRIEEVNAKDRSVKLSGVDLVDGTPVLDIKPYVPDYDCPQPTGFDHSGANGGGRVGDESAGVRVADWVGASVKHRRRVEWAPEAALQLEEACVDRKRGSRTVVGTMRFFRGDHVGARRAITESLSVDVRSLHKTRVAQSAPSCILLFDGLRVEFSATVISPAVVSGTEGAEGATFVTEAERGAPALAQLSSPSLGSETNKSDARRSVRISVVDTGPAMMLHSEEARVHEQLSERVGGTGAEEGEEVDYLPVNFADPLIPRETVLVLSVVPDADLANRYEVLQGGYGTTLSKETTTRDALNT